MANELDKINQLPGNIIDQILSRMPIKDAVRTSILSRKWRYKWCSLPQLVFDGQCTNATSPHENLVKIIDKVLLLHTGPLQKFKLSHQGICVTSDIDHWILYLSRISIKEIVLDIWNLQNYKIPTSLFNCQDLTHLELHGCLVKIPSTFEGFKNLESLDLSCIDLSPDGLEALISRCPLLKRLGLKYLKRFTRIKIKGCNLESLDLSGAFLDVAFGIMKRLKSVSIGFSADIFNKHGHNLASFSNLRKFFRCLPKTQNLKLENYSLKYLAIGNVSQTLPYALDHLKYLFICIDFNRKEEILTVMCLIKSSPQLKQVDFQNHAKDQQTARIGTVVDFREEQSVWCQEQVQVVSMSGIFGSEPELELMKFLLASLPNLQKMTIQPIFKHGEGKLLRELLRFQ